MSNAKAARVVSKKRKHLTEPAEAVKQKRAKKTASFDDNDDDELNANGLDHAFAKMDSRLLSDYVSQRVRCFGGDLSSVEMEDKHISGKWYTLSFTPCELLPCPIYIPRIYYGLLTPAYYIGD